VVIAKLKHGDPNQPLESAASRDWDHHRQSVQNLTRSIEKKWKRDLTWQTVDGHVATVDDLLQTPVLFISGRDQLQMSSEQRENLREYVARGGFIFAEACCGGKAFDQSFRELMKEIFPNSPLRLLPADHAVWFAEAKVDPKYMRPLYGIEACCRTSIVYCPSDLSCYWELSQSERDSGYPPGVQEEIDACVQIGQNVVAYATNRILKDKLERPQHSRDLLQEQLARGMLYIPKLHHEGGDDDAPNSLSNLLRFVGEKVEMRVSPNHLMLEPTDPGIFDFPILFMHGRREFQLQSAQRKVLATYLQRGGLIIADSICANEQFSQSFRREMEAVLPGRRFERISPDHPMFSQQFGGFDLSTVTLRDPLLRADEGEPLEARLTRINPLLEGITLDDRLAVIFSPYDLSCGLENHASLECKGYISADAAKIGLNLILFGLQQ
jgi:hypothetical protein